MLASQSPARLETLRRAGVEPKVIVSGVDEDAHAADTAVELVRTLARAKGEAVAAVHTEPGDHVIVACDSVLEFEGEVHGKPSSSAEAAGRWQRLRGRRGLLHTGHHLIARVAGQEHRATEVATTRVHFAEVTDAEIDAYVATGEPAHVAGAFTIDGLGGPFISSIEGDPHNVIGISLPLLRTMLAGIGIPWPALWSRFGAVTIPERDDP